MNRRDFINTLEKNGVFFERHGTRHDVFVHKETGKKLTVPRHREFSNNFLKDVLKEIPGFSPSKRK